ncbi:MAG: hypothetical protein CML69_00920 [Rhodobacteraceae bacterium]|nr:hypothetical protein [Paracoccaceae bacterium]
MSSFFLGCGVGAICMFFTMSIGRALISFGAGVVERDDTPSNMTQDDYHGVIFRHIELDRRPPL